MKSLSSVLGEACSNEWIEINPDQHGDWLNQRDSGLMDFTVLGQKKGDGIKIFQSYSFGVNTARDAWCYNASKEKVEKNMSKMIDFYNSEVDRFNESFGGLDKVIRENSVNGFIDTDPKKISWAVNEKTALSRGSKIEFYEDCIVKSMYRPFTKRWLYFNKNFNHSLYQMPRIFPNASEKNLIICVSGIGARTGFSAYLTDLVTSYDNLEKGQCFPLYLYEATARKTVANDLFDYGDDGLDITQSLQYTRRDAITDDGLAHFADYYAAQNNGQHEQPEISKEDLFYYIYGLLHSEDYRERYADNLSKELPRIPRVKNYADFKHFSDAGRQLAHYHLNYETVEPYEVSFNTDINRLSDEDFYVTKMKFGAGKDKTTVIYNDKITMSGIPLDAFAYLVNGKAALDWVMERQLVKPDKKSGIVNDANDWANETMHNPRYPLELLQRVITVSLATLKIVRGLPKLDIE